jgi:hypothetical protein
MVLTSSTKPKGEREDQKPSRRKIEKEEKARNEKSIEERRR